MTPAAEPPGGSVGGPPGGARPGHIEFVYVDPGRLEQRASIAFKVLAAINGFAVVLALVPANPPVATLHTVAFNFASAVVVAILAVTAFAIDRERPWAIAAIRPLAAGLLIAGTALLVMTIADGRLRVPFDAILGGWVLLGRPATRPLPRPERRTGIAAGAASLALVLMLAAGWLFRWGGVLDVQPSHLSATLTADCTDRPAAPDGQPPESITVAYDWRWSTWRPFPSGTDAVIIGWDGNDGAGKVAYFIGTIPDPEDAIYPGHRAYPSAAMASEVMQETRNHWVWGIKLDAQGYDPGHVEVELELVNDAPGAEPLRITATYVHEGAWRQDSATLTCAW